MGGITIPANDEDGSSSSKRVKQELDEESIDVGIASSTSSAGTDNQVQLSQETYVPGATCVTQQQQNQLHLQTDNNSDNEALVVDGDGPSADSMSEYIS